MKDSVNISNILINMYGRDISLDDLSFIDTIQAGYSSAKSILDFFDDLIPYNEVTVYDKPSVDLFYFLNLRLLEILLEKDELDESVNKLFEVQFKDAYINDTTEKIIPQNYSKLKYMVDVLISNACALDFYYSTVVYTKVIFDTYGYMMNFSKMTFSDIYSVLNHFGHVMLPTRIVIDFIMKAETKLGKGWYYRTFYLDINNLEEFLNK